MSRLRAYNLARSFACALCGVARSLQRERNLRIHFFAAAYVLYFSRYFDISPGEYAALFSVIGLVIACEMVNTSVEAAVDLSTPTYSNLAKTAKDAAAGAVLTAGGASVAVGFSLFWRPDVLSLIWRDILGSPLVWLFALAATVFLITWPERRSLAGDTGKNNCAKENP